MPERNGYRGYISSRPFLDNRVPQHVQNLVIRDYCERNNLLYLLSATEYAMSGSYMMLEQVVAELSQIEGLVMYSLFQLPDQAAQRRYIFQRVLSSGAVLHMALEGLSIRQDSDIQRIEDIWAVRQTLPHCITAIL